MKFRHFAALLIALLFLAVPATAAADCQAPSSVEEAIAEAPVVFVGTVVVTRENAPGAGFEVEEIWAGEVPATVGILGIGLSGDDQYSEDDRTWQLGSRYLVIPYRGDDGRLRDHICTGTTRWRPALAELRPAGAHAPEAVATPEPAEVVAPLADAPFTMPWLTIVVALVAILVLVGVAVAAFRETGRRDISV